MVYLNYVPREISIIQLKHNATSKDLTGSGMTSKKKICVGRELSQPGGGVCAIGTFKLGYVRTGQFDIPKSQLK